MQQCHFILANIIQFGLPGPRDGKSIGKPKGGNIKQKFPPGSIKGIKKKPYLQIIHNISCGWKRTKLMMVFLYPLTELVLEIRIPHVMIEIF